MTIITESQRKNSLDILALRPGEQYNSYSVKEAKFKSKTIYDLERR